MIKKIATLFILTAIFGCTATNKFKGPNYTLMPEDSSNVIIRPLLFTNTDNITKQITTITFNEGCSDSESVHSAIIWVPLIGPTVDLFLIPSPSSLTTADFLDYIPLIGPPIAYVHGTQSCSYHGIMLDNKMAIESKLPISVLQTILTVSDKNCMKYQNTIIGGSNELSANQKIVQDGLTVIQAGASFGNGIAGVGVAGLKQMLSSTSDIVSAYFFQNNAAQLFQNIWLVRQNLKDMLLNNTANNWGYIPDIGISLYNAESFVKEYDESCLLEQAINDLNSISDLGQKTISDAVVAPNTSKNNTTQSILLRGTNLQ